jgi:hypothetical protein
MMAFESILLRPKEGYVRFLFCLRKCCPKGDVVCPNDVRQSILGPRPTMAPTAPPPPEAPASPPPDTPAFSMSAAAGASAVAPLMAYVLCWSERRTEASEVSWDLEWRYGMELVQFSWIG